MEPLPWTSCFYMAINGNQFITLVTGGPGSGKVTHCDNLMQEKKGITHINMTDLLQQYAIGNGELSLITFYVSSYQWK